MTLDPKDIKAIADEIEKRLLPHLSHIGQPTEAASCCQPKATAEPDIEAMKQRALDLARQGKRQESIDVMKSISKLCRHKPAKGKPAKK